MRVPGSNFRRIPFATRLVVLLIARLYCILAWGWVCASVPTNLSFWKPQELSLRTASTRRRWLHRKHGHG
jgi:hypothetical protein